MIQALGKVTVVIPGTPVRVTAGQTDPAKRLSVHALLVQALSANTGKIYIGDATLNKTTLVGVYAVLPIPTINTLPTFGATLTLAPAGIQIQDLYLDAEVGGEGVLVTVLIT